MTKFTKDQFINDSGYVTYCMDPMPCSHDRRKFVARFKYARGGAGSFVTFVIKNFTVEEYFARMEAGETPLAIAESKGYVMPHIKTWLKRDGYPTTQAGYHQWLDDRAAKRKEA